MKKPKKKPNPQRRCIFCNGTPVSGEHLFSDWISTLVPKSTQQHTNIRWKTTKGDADRHVTASKRIEGDLSSKKLRAPCIRCNETWMSVLENQAKPVLTPLILGQTSSIFPDAQKRIRQWAILKTIIGEQDHPQSAVIATESIDHFYRTHELPPNHSVWIGHYKGDVWRGTHYYHRAVLVTPFDMPKDGVIGPNRPNSQTTTLVIGELYIHIFSAPPPILYNIGFPGNYRLAELPFNSTSTIEWPLSIPLHDQFAMGIAYGRPISQAEILQIMRAFSRRSW